MYLKAQIDGQEQHIYVLDEGDGYLFALPVVHDIDDLVIIAKALKDQGITTKEFDYANCHGRCTNIYDGDAIVEAMAEYLDADELGHWASSHLVISNEIENTSFDIFLRLAQGIEVIDEESPLLTYDKQYGENVVTNIR